MAMKIRRTAMAVAVVVVVFRANVAKGQKPPEILHEVISDWAEGDRVNALKLVRMFARPPDREPGTLRSENAALRNLGARLLYENYLWSRRPQLDKATDDLREAEIFAAAAVWENPYNLTYWNDYVHIAAERRVIHAPRSRPLSREQSVEKLRLQLLHDELLYPELTTGFALTGSPELRHVGNAIIHRIQGDVFNAESILESWVSEPIGRTRCVAAVVLVEMQLDVDRFGEASKSVDEFLPICAGSAHDLLLSRRDLLENSVRLPMDDGRNTSARKQSQARFGYQAQSSPRLRIHSRLRIGFFVTPLAPKTGKICATPPARTIAPPRYRRGVTLNSSLPAMR
jgi:hypothetical protein